MLRELRPAIVLVIILTLITGLVYPLVMTGIAGVLFPTQAQGSLVEVDGKVVGSSLIGQEFTSDKYFHGRPSATTAPDPNDSSKTVSAPYNAANSGGSNLGPTNKALIDRVKADVDKLKQENPSAAVPIDLVTTTASGLDPDIIAGGGIVPGAAGREGPQYARGSRSPARQRPRRGSLSRPLRRAAGQRACPQHGPRRLDEVGLPKLTRRSGIWQTSSRDQPAFAGGSCSKPPAGRKAASASCAFSSVPPPASARPTPCWRRRARAARTATTLSSAVVETHGRRETEALLEGLEVIPRRRIEYRGQWLDEMDLDAIIARRPQIVLVDELAHTNAPGSRHPKRCLDVEELLNRGINVYSTVNIQHIESLNDVVAQITGVRVRETVPDRVFDRADSVELVDLTPDDLIERLKEGKVYVPKQAERALEHFFSPPT